MLNSSRATKLMIFATIVATLRFVLLHGVFSSYAFPIWFKGVEAWSGIAFAVLEGVALAYISRRWRKIELTTRANKVYWSVLLVGQLLSLVAITWTIGMAGMAARRDVHIQDFLTPGAEFVWSLMVAGLNPLILMLIGIVEDEDEKPLTYTEPAKDQRLLVLEAVSTHGMLDPGSLAEVAGVPMEVAVRELNSLHSAFGVVNGSGKVKK